MVLHKNDFQSPVAHDVHTLPLDEQDHVEHLCIRGILLYC